MSDKEILVQAVNKYAKTLASQLLGINSIAGQTAITYVINNLENKYGGYLDIFVNKQGNIDIKVLGEAFKEELKARNGYVMSVFGKHIKFDHKDIEELVSIYHQMKSPKQDD